MDIMIHNNSDSRYACGYLGTWVRAPTLCMDLESARASIKQSCLDNALNSEIFIRSFPNFDYFNYDYSFHSHHLLVCYLILEDSFLSPRRDFYYKFDAPSCIDSKFQDKCINFTSFHCLYRSITLTVEKSHLLADLPRSFHTPSPTCDVKVINRVPMSTT